MQYERLGNSGLIVSKICLGTLSFGKGLCDAAMHKVDQPLADRMVAESFDQGVNYFNTADVYAEGASEIMLAKALGSRRADAVVCTKVGLRNGSEVIHQGLSRRHILGSVEASLRRLQTDWIDVLILHCPDPHTPLDEILDAVQQLIQSGKVRYVGVSNWPAWVMAKAVAMQKARHWVPFQAAEVYYNLLTRDVEHELVPMALDAGIGLQPWSPLAGGALSGRTSAAQLRQESGPVSNYSFLPIDRGHVANVVAAMEGVASRTGATISQVALAWLMGKSAVASVIIGPSRMDQLQDNLAAARVELSSEDRAMLDEMTGPPLLYPGWYGAKFADPMVRDALK
jgi:aryl-alcohol dehydrogenase-like predicted oxidoreductase